MSKFILALDQGTTSSRAILFNRDGEPLSITQKEFRQIFPKPGWVEHDAEEIWSTQLSVAVEAISKQNLTAENIQAIGITNQRETTVVWDKKTGKPIYNAIVWQDRRTSDYCDELRKEGYEEMVRNKTGLVIDAYFVGTKVKWILDHIEGAREKAEDGELLLGTIDSWLVWKLSGGQRHITDITNASRSLIYNINTLEWDDELLSLFSIPKTMLPTVVASSGDLALTSGAIFAKKIPITGIAGDQQAALFGQMCLSPGMVKNTYGTGCFMLMNIGNKPLISKNRLLTTIGWKINNEVIYAFEGSIFISGAVVQWLRDGLQIISSASEVEALANAVTDTNGVFFVPSFTGLGAPYWNQHARGTMVGITRGTTKNHIARAALESIALQTYDVLTAMEADSGLKIKELRVDGGATANNFLMQIQSDVLNTQLIRPQTTEITALGAAYLAGLGSGYWKSVDDIKKKWKASKTFSPDGDNKRNELIAGWKRAIATTQKWSEK